VRLISEYIRYVLCSSAVSCVNFSQILKPHLFGGVHCLSFPACFFVMLVRWPSRILLFSLIGNIWGCAGKKCVGTIALAWIFHKLVYQPCFSLQWLIIDLLHDTKQFFHISFQAVSRSLVRTYTEMKWVIAMLILTLHFFTSDFRLLSSYACESIAVSCPSSKKMHIRDF